jgi:tripartite-type tricarboxylate transporter receptor subunit TctC
MLATPALLAAPGAGAQAWPDRPVRIIVAFTAGGTTDIIARLVGNALSQLWGQPAVVENRPGAGGNIGTETVVRSAPDGYTLLVGSNGPMAVNHSLYRNLPYDARRDLSAITLLAEVQNLLVVPQASPVRDVAGLVALARSRRNDPLSYGSTGIGTASHLAGALLSRMLAVELTHVPYRGALAVNDLLSRRLDFMFATAPSVNEQVRGGLLRALAVSGRRRSRHAGTTDHGGVRLPGLRRLLLVRHGGAGPNPVSGCRQDRDGRHRRAAPTGDRAGTGGAGCRASGQHARRIQRLHCLGDRAVVGGGPGSRCNGGLAPHQDRGRQALTNQQQIKLSACPRIH